METPGNAVRLQTSPPTSSELGIVAAILLGLIVAIGCVFSGAGDCNFILLDDPNHIYENELVRGGLTLGGIREAFAAPHSSLWVPLTTCSFMLDVSLWGLNPKFFHLENVAWHAGAAALLFLALWKMTAQLWPSALVAALFGLHPINVESVVWVTERKNVLCGFFAMLSLCCWVQFVRNGRRKIWFGTALIAFSLALLAKPMAVTLPCFFVLLDAWPLRRFGVLPLRRLVVEKAPFFLLAFGASRMATWATAPFQTLVTLKELSVASRLANALNAYLSYLGQLLWPADFALIYPYPVPDRWVSAGASLGVLTAFSWAAWRLRRTQPWLLVGWLTFLGMLVPSIGLVQVGSQARADRFTYLAQIGIFIVLVWSARRFWPRSAERWRAPLAGVLLIVLGSISALQASFWRESVTLFEHSLGVTGPHPQILDLAASAHARRGEYELARQRWQESVALWSGNAAAWSELGAVLMRFGQTAQALDCFQHSTALDPTNVVAKFNLASAFERMGKPAEAKSLFVETLQMNPNLAAAHYRLALMLEANREFPAAREHLLKAAQLRPEDALVVVALERLEKQSTAPLPAEIAR